MVLVSPVVHKEKPMDLTFKVIHYGLFRSDFLFWMWADNFESDLTTFLGVPPEVQKELTPDEKTWLSHTFIPSLHPISQRRAGMINDGIHFIMIDYHLDHITVPTLIVYAEDDTLVNSSHGKYAAQNIPNARVITLEQGGHLLMGQHRRVRSEISTFLESNI